MKRAFIEFGLVITIYCSFQVSGSRQKQHNVKAQTATTKSEDEPDYPIDEYLENCFMTHVVSPSKPFKFQTPYYPKSQYPANFNCSWNFVGDTNCTLSVSCSELDLRPSEDCTEDYLEITDGFSGQELLCGSVKAIKNLKARSNARDINVNLVTGENPTFSRLFKGGKCEVKCGGGVKEMKEALRPKEELRCRCGLQNKNDRIVGGENAKMNEFPWIAAIVFAGSRQPICGASIINNKYILTAAHCFSTSGLRAKDIEVLLHAYTLDMTLKAGWKDVALGIKGSIRGSGYDLAAVTDQQEGSQRYKVMEIKSHPLFTAKYDYDVALLRLAKPISLHETDSPTPICLPKPGSYDETFDNSWGFISGWGLPDQNAGGTTRVLQKLSVPVIPLDRCRKWTSNTLTQRMLCAGYEQGGKDACMGDSGGPLSLYSNDTKTWTQIGIVSWGEGCARKQHPGLYSRLTELVQWVRANSVGATWCSE